MNLEPDPVGGIHFTSITSYSVTVNWIPSGGLVDYYNVSLSKNTIETKLVNNETFSCIFNQLIQKTKYSVTVTAVRDYLESGPKTESFETLNINSIFNDTEFNIIIQNISVLPDPSIYDLIDATSIELDSSENILGSLNITSLIVASIAEQSGNSTILEGIINLTDKTLTKSDEIILNDIQIGNRLSESMEKAVAKINLNSSNDFQFVKNYSNFYIKSKMIYNFTLKDTGLFLEGNF